MKSQALIDAFEVLAEAPDGVGRLRELVLRLAVRGKLVPQDPGDEPAGSMLGDRELTLDEHVPFELPPGWAWSSFGQLGDVRGGGTPSKRNGDYWGGLVPWVTPKDMKRDLIEDSRDHITELAIESSSVKRIPRDSLLMVVRGMILAHSFPTALTSTEVTVNQDMKALTPFDASLAPFLLLMTKGRKVDVLGLVQTSTHGTCRLPTAELFGMPIGIPPLAEQRSIVAKVDELMTLLDEFEDHRNTRLEMRRAFAHAAFHAFATADTAPKLTEAWTRVHDSWELCTADRESIDLLRGTVMGLACTGTLSSGQSHNPLTLEELERKRASELDWFADAQRLEGRRVPKPAPFLEAAPPHELPRGWTSVRLESACTAIVDCPHSTPKFISKGKWCVDTTCIRPFVIEAERVRRVSAASFAERTARLLPKPGDILFSREGTIGTAVQVPDDVELCLGQRMMLFRFASFVDPSYAEIFLQSQVFREAYAPFIKGTAAKHVNIRSLRPLPFFIPPFEEQLRIVNRVRELEVLINDLEQRLANKTAAHDAFAAAAVHHLDT
jgi:type I restriction enzyme S subunit